MKTTTKCPATDIVLVTYKSEEFLPRLLEDLRSMTEFPYVLHQFENVGNARTLSALWNDLAAKGDCEYIAIMNPDIALSPKWDRRLIDAIRRDRTIGVATPDPMDSSPTPAPMPSRETMKDLSSERARNRRITEESVQFYVAMIPRRVWDPLKGVDERMRFYMQDSEFIDRTKKRFGLRAVRVHACPIWHRGSASTAKAMQDGELDQKLEYETSMEVWKELEASGFIPWDKMTKTQRAAVRSSKYGKLGAR